MINSDVEAYNIIISTLNSENTSINGRKILEITKDLLKYYSFVENQTYPRPSHPYPEKRKDAYFTLIAILLSLRTTLENEMKAVNNFCNRYSNVYDVANADINELITLIKCAGMPKKKAETIINVSKYIINNLNGDINNINDGNIDHIRDFLFKIPGLGEKSVDCMLELAFDMPSIVIDINVFRVVSRMFFSDRTLSFEKNKDILEIKNFIESNIIADYRLYQIVHTILLLHGKFVCKSTPNCHECCIFDRCQYCSINEDSHQLRLF